MEQREVKTPLYGLQILLLVLFCAEARGQEAAAPALDAKTGVVHSQRLRSGVPFGGIGAGAFQMLTDGSIARLPGRTTGTNTPTEMPACFGAVWTRVNGKTETRLLALRNAYGLPGVVVVDYDGLYPQARLSFPNASLPLEASVLAYTPLIPFDLKNSTLPAAAFVYRLHNTSPVPIEAAVALSWGEGYSEESQVASVPDEGGFFSLRLSGRPKSPTPGLERPAAEQTEETTLMAAPPSRDTVVTRAAWNADEKRPGWWDSFAQEGQIPDLAAGTLPSGEANAGVLVVRLTVRPGGTVEVPFAVAWYAAHRYAPSGEDLGHAYQNAFPTSRSVARYLLDNRLSLYALTEEWQKRLLFSNFPVWLSRRLINSATPLTSDTLLTRDGRFVWEGEPGAPDLPLTSLPPETTEQREARLGAFSVLLALYPALAAQEVRHSGSRIALSNGLPPPEEAALYTLLLTQYARWTNDPSLLHREYSHLRRALASLLPAESGSPRTEPDTLSTPDWTLRLAALSAGQSLAELDSAQAFTEALKDGAVGNLASALPRMEADRRLAEACRTALTAGMQRLIAARWTGAYFADAADKTCAADQLFGAWVTASLGTEPLFVPDKLTTALHSLQTKNDAVPGFALAPLRRVDAAGAALPQSAENADCLLPAAVLSEAILAIWQNQADIGVNLLQRLENARNEGLRSPWRSPLSFRADTGQATPDSTKGLAQAADWNALYALTGFGYDPALGRLTMSPKIPGTWRTLTAPVFAPTFWGRVQFKPLAHGGTLSFRLDRFIAVTPQTPERKSGQTRLVLKSLRVPGLLTGAGGAPVVHVSLGPNPLGVRTAADSSGDLIVTFITPLSLAAGDRLEVDVH